MVFLVIMTSLATNAIFYQYKTYLLPIKSVCYFDKVRYGYHNIGEKILTAFWSSLIIIPPNFITVSCPPAYLAYCYFIIFDMAYIFILKKSANWRMRANHIALQAVDSIQSIGSLDVLCRTPSSKNESDLDLTDFAAGE